MKKFIGIMAVLTVIFGITAAANAAQITEAQAKEIALKHAGVTAQQANFTKMKLDRDFGRTEYELEFFVGNVEYGLRDRRGGRHGAQVLARDPRGRPVPERRPAGTARAGTDRRAEGDGQIALARVPGAKPEHVRELKLDYDDGMQLYEGEIFYNFREYEFEINAVTGEVVGWEID